MGSKQVKEDLSDLNEKCMLNAVSRLGVVKLILWTCKTLFQETRGLTKEKENREEKVEN